jgi:hypothetical protein
MKKALSVTLGFALSILVTTSYGQVARISRSGGTNVSTANAKLFPLSELKEGMKGVARTVFRGSEPEEFNVEILGILPGGIGPRQDLIVGRLSGGSAERTSVFAGMSGSPVYIDGKLVGAISYSFPFSKEPICGITPIEQMIAIFKQKPLATPGTSEPKAVAYTDLMSPNWQVEGPRNSGGSVQVATGIAPNSRLAAVSGQTFQPIATPITFSGFSQETLNQFSSQLLQAGLMPVSAAGGSAPLGPMKPADETTLLGGDSVSMQLTRGDYSLAASGTVTLRDGETIYAFGHPFLALGSSDLPMSESHVVTVIPNLNNSFKIAVPDSMVGSMTQDRATGVYGKLGQAPKMIPVRIDLHTSRGQNETVNFEVARDDFLTPLLLNMATVNALAAQERGLGDATVQMTAEIKLKGREPLRIERRFAGGQAAQLAGMTAASPVATLFRSRFDDMNIERIELDLSAADGSKTGVLERLAVDKTRVRPGEMVEVQAFIRTDSGRTVVQRIATKIPEDVPAGPLAIMVGDGNSVQQNSNVQQFVPKNLDELITTINRLKVSDRLYLQTVRTSNGAVIGVSEMPNLPPSVLATINSNRVAGGFKPTVQTVISEQPLDRSEYIVTGQQTLAIEVID